MKIIKEEFDEELMKRFEDKEDIYFRDKIKELISSLKGNNSNLKLARIFNDESGYKQYKIVEIYGGLNGTGDWEDYLNDLLDLLKLFKNEFKTVWIVDFYIDTLDDVWSVYYGIRDYEEFYV